MTTKSGKGLLGYAVDTVVSPAHNDDGNLMVAEQIASSCCVAQIASSEKGIWEKCRWEAVVQKRQFYRAYRWLGWENTSWDQNFGPPVPAKSFASITLLIMMKLMASIIKLVW